MKWLILSVFLISACVQQLPNIAELSTEFEKHRPECKIVYTRGMNGKTDFLCKIYGKQFTSLGQEQAIAVYYTTAIENDILLASRFKDSFAIDIIFPDNDRSKYY